MYLVEEMWGMKFLLLHLPECYAQKLEIVKISKELIDKILVDKKPDLLKIQNIFVTKF